MLRTRLLAVLVLLGTACGGTTIPMEPPEDRGPGIALGRSLRPRTGELTWNLRSLERDGDLLRVDLDLTNGTSRQLEHGLLRVILYGPDGEQWSGRVPFAGIRPGSSRLLSAHFSQVPFRVVDLGLEAIFVSP